MAIMNERDIAKLRGDYHRALKRANELHLELMRVSEVSEARKQSLEKMTAEFSKMKRKLTRLQNKQRNKLKIKRINKWITVN